MKNKNLPQMKFKKVVIPALITVLSIITGGISVYAFITGNSVLPKKPREGLFHSPWLGIEILQDDKKVEMVSVSSDADEKIKARMDAKPFELRFEKKDDVVMICVWEDNSIFQAVQKGFKTEEIPCFGPGTGIADTTYSLQRLHIDNEAHNHFAGERLKNHSESQHSISISQFVRDKNEYEVSKQKKPLYMVVFMDKNKNTIIDNDELEYFILDFG